MQLSRGSQKAIAIGLFCIFLLSFVFLYNHFTTISDPYIFENEDKTVNFDVPSFYGGGTTINQNERIMSHKIINSSEIVIYCNRTDRNYMVFEISLKNDTYDVHIYYKNDFTTSEPTKEYTDLEYNVESELSLINEDIADGSTAFLSIEVILIIST